MNSDQATRKCKKCYGIFPLESFPFSNKKKGWRRHECFECNKKRVQKHHNENKERRLRLQRERYKSNPQSNWPEDKKQRKRDLQKARNARLRDQVISEYGGKCQCCGEDNLLFLTLDHVNNDGSEMRKNVHGKASVNIYSWIIQNNYPKDFQILCMNCNFGKARNGGVCPHQEGSTTISQESRAKRPEARRNSKKS